MGKEEEVLDSQSQSAVLYVMEMGDVSESSEEEDNCSIACFISELSAVLEMTAFKVALILC